MLKKLVENTQEAERPAGKLVERLAVKLVENTQEAELPAGKLVENQGGEVGGEYPGGERPAEIQMVDTTPPTLNSFSIRDNTLKSI